MLMTIFVAEELEPIGCNPHHICQVAVNLLYLGLDACHEFVGLVLIKLQYALHLDFEEFEDVVLGHLAHELRIIGSESLVDMLAHCIHVGGLFKLAVLVYPLLDEYLFERSEMILFEQFRLAYLEFLAQQVLGVIDGVAQYVTNGEKLRFVVLDDTTVGRDVHLAVGEGIEGIEGLVGRNSGSKVHLNLDLGGCVVIHLACLDFSLLDGLEDGIDEGCGGLAKGYLADDESLVVELLYLSPHLKRSSTLSVVVFSHVDTAPGGEIGVELEGTFVEIGYGCVAYLAEVMREYLGRQAHGNTFDTLSQKQWILHGQGDGFLVAAVVAHLPLGGLGIEHGVEGKLRQSRLDISGGGSTVACEDITPVTLGVNQQFLLSQLHEGVADGGIAMGVELHGVSHDIRHFVESPVVHTLHRMEDASLHRFQSVLDMRDGTLKYYV